MVINCPKNRLDEQHTFTTQTFGFLIHPNIPALPPNAKIADVGTGTGIWLLDVAKTLPATCELRGFDVLASSFPARETWPANVTFATHDMHAPFSAAELGTYDVVAVRFVSSATPRAAWARAVANLATLLRPAAGWLQWIDSANFALYSSAPGASRAACQQIYDGLRPFRPAPRNGDDDDDDAAVIGLMMREPGNLRRPDVWRALGLVDVHEDVFSTDRLQDPALRLRDRGTRNVIECFVGCLQSLVGVEGSGWTRERIERLNAEAMREIDAGVYHTLDQICIVGRRAG
ncbi:hypothetical protein B0T26DRAFT_741616 [Lasiosphaeria miniovina]|uniref:Methyltransferase domain-containing protein n=1 Tax=Lasiosphaeria miniovina TaxID=1954250 RepID=A0AA40AAW8_9PEZI|nr:uncharacterized protein B0T26DRAFT_741616 [Lasiosphaeria miniovina]KAK0712508.1 hypothetical protein B0T26DRAFT_741616 [Lasiosphaeria miniovina]